MACTQECWVSMLCHCESVPNNLWMIPTIGRDAWGLLERKHHFYLQVGQEWGARDLQASQSYLLPWKDKKQVNPDTISRHVKDRKIIRSCQHEFAMRKSRLTNLINVYSEMARLIDNSEYSLLHFDKAFDTVSHKILRHRLLVYGLDNQWGKLTTVWMIKPREWCSGMQSLVGS